MLSAALESNDSYKTGFYERRNSRPRSSFRPPEEAGDWRPEAGGPEIADAEMETMWAKVIKVAGSAIKAEFSDKNGC
jgi:hypothetical protein